MPSIANLVMGLLAGWATYVFGVRVSRYVDTPALEILTAMIPLVVVVAGNWLLAHFLRPHKHSPKAGELAYGLTAGLLVIPLYLMFLGNDYQVLGGISTGFLVIPGILMSPFLAAWTLRRFGGAN